MAPRRGAPEYDLCALLPLPLALRVFMALPADTRACCACVCRNWRAVLADSAAWLRLDLSAASGVTCTVDAAALKAAAARAGGRLEALCVPGAARKHADTISERDLLDVVELNGGTLRELCFPDSLRGSGQPVHMLEPNAAFTRTLLASAPALERLEVDFAGDVAEACLALRRQPPYAQLQIASLWVANRDGVPYSQTTVREMWAHLADHASLTRLMVVVVPLSAPALAALVDSCLPRVRELSLFVCRLTSECVPSLVRLLSPGSALTSLRVDERYHAGDPPLLDAAGAAALAQALRATRTLTRLELVCIGLWRDGVAAAAPLLGALTGHPSLRELDLGSNDAEQTAERVGGLLGALVAADTLSALSIYGCGLGDEGLAPVVHALRSSTRLTTLSCFDNQMSSTFARHALLPAVRANASLRVLVAQIEDDEEEDEDGELPCPWMREAEQLVVHARPR